MPKYKKKYFRKRFNHLKTQPYYFLLDNSNLTSNQINKILTTIRIPSCHTALTYTNPPKITGGCLKIKIFPKTLKNLETYLENILPKIICLGLFVKEKWYPLQLLYQGITSHKKFKTIALLINKNNNNWLL